MAGYGAQLGKGKTHEQAVEYLRELFKRVRQDKSARESLQTFTGERRRRPPRVRERGDPGPGEGRGPRLRRPGPDGP